VSKLVVNLVYRKTTGSMSRKAVLLAMAERANDDGSGIWVSKTRIAAEIECSRQTVITVMQEMEAEGLIVAVDKKQGKNGYTIVYRLSIRALFALPDAWPEITSGDTLDLHLDAEEVLDLAVSNFGQRKAAPMSKRGGADVKLSDKNRPYRTIDTNTDLKQETPKPETPLAKASRLRAESVKLRVKDPARSRKLEEEADEIAREILADERAKSAPINFTKTLEG